jgi:class 3 adenylate cyclase
MFPRPPANRVLRRMEGLPATVPRYGDDIGGIGVHIGARASALAGPNEVLVSSTLRDLVIGSGLEFEERGTHQLKGVPGEWHLSAVTSS